MRDDESHPVNYLGQLTRGAQLLRDLGCLSRPREGFGCPGGTLLVSSPIKERNEDKESSARPDHNKSARSKT